MKNNAFFGIARKNNYGVIDKEGQACREEASRREWKFAIILRFINILHDPFQSGLMVITYPEVSGRLTLTKACPESVQCIQEVGHSPQRSLKWERHTDLDFRLFIQPF